jgi:hypothetical protein
MLSNTDPVARWHQISLGPGGIDRLDCTMDSFIIENRSFFCEYQQNRYGFVDLAKMARLSLKFKKMRNFEIKDL